MEPSEITKLSQEGGDILVITIAADSSLEQTRDVTTGFSSMRSLKNYKSHFSGYVGTQMIKVGLRNKKKKGYMEKKEKHIQMTH